MIKPAFIDADHPAYNSANGKCLVLWWEFLGLVLAF
jgi:hypothetical protein